MLQFKRGYTLVELLVVIAIIGILTGIFARESAKQRIRNERKSEALVAYGTAVKAKAAITNHFMTRREFPLDNAAARFPPAINKVANVSVSSVIDEGAIQVNMTWVDAEHHPIKVKQLTIRPAYLSDSPNKPHIKWICGYKPVPDGYTAMGKDQTTFDSQYLPRQCR